MGQELGILGEKKIYIVLKDIRHMGPSEYIFLHYNKVASNRPQIHSIQNY